MSREEIKTDAPSSGNVGKEGAEMKEAGGMEEILAEIKEAGREDILHVLDNPEGWEDAWAEIERRVKKTEEAYGNTDQFPQELWKEVLTVGFMGRSIHNLFCSVAILDAYFHDAPVMDKLRVRAKELESRWREVLERAHASIVAGVPLQRPPTNADIDYDNADPRLLALPEVSRKIIEAAKTDSNLVIALRGVGIASAPGPERVRPGVYVLTPRGIDGLKKELERKERIGVPR